MENEGKEEKRVHLVEGFPTQPSKAVRETGQEQSKMGGCWSTAKAVSRIMQDGLRHIADPNQSLGIGIGDRELSIVRVPNHVRSQL